MASSTQPASGVVYDDFEPLYEWVREERLVKVMLPGKCISFSTSQTLYPLESYQLHYAFNV